MFSILSVLLVSNCVPVASAQGLNTSAPAPLITDSSDPFSGVGKKTPTILPIEISANQTAGGEPSLITFHGPAINGTSSKLSNGTRHPNATGKATTVTKVVSTFTTYCPSPTTFSTNGQTFTVTAPTTLTITVCPCTLSHEIHSASEPAGVPPSESQPAFATGAPGGVESGVSSQPSSNARPLGSQPASASAASNSTKTGNTLANAARGKFSAPNIAYVAGAALFF